MKTNSRIFAFLMMVTLMAMRFPQDIKQLSYQAYLTQDKNAWKQNVALATQTYQSQPKEENLFHLALTEYGLLNATMVDQDERLFDAYADGLEKRLTTLTKSKTYGAEAKALLSSLYGFKIAYSPMKGMFLGPKSSGLLEEAFGQAPNSPIVLKMMAGNKYFTPETWGGDKDEALQLFQKSNQAFEKSGKEQNWMYLDNLAWIGMIHLEKGNEAKAKEVWTEAVKMEPNFHWVAKGLLADLN
jgi:tetratricopeptide (TPR) repeat protein